MLPEFIPARDRAQTQRTTHVPQLWTPTVERVRIDGKHLASDGSRYTVKGVTYGSFRRRADGHRFPDSKRIDADFALMARSGLNTVRTYELPPRDLLDAAARHGLRVLVGLHFHDWRLERTTGAAARRRIREAGRAAVDDAMQLCAGRADVLAISIGNEVPVDLVRLHGIASVEDVLAELIDRVHAADAHTLATYVNYPTTEFLQVEGQDLVCFNVFLERRETFATYLRHLQSVAGPRPLLLTELGLCSVQHGVERQQQALEWQLQQVVENGAAGATVFAWTDEWAVADVPVEQWGFGVTTADRQEKPALETLRRWAKTASTRGLRQDWPRVTVVVCAYNEERMIGGCLDSLVACDYPGLEVIVCDDGSHDRTREIAATYPFRLLDLPHGGLSAARNAGIEAATGEYVAFLDADARCHPEWPYHLVLSMAQPGVAATGGPNPPVETAGFVERAVALSPGGPIEVLLSDDRAEHVPGCNMAFRRDVLRSLGGFIPAYTSAGDDVDLCWRLLDAGHQIAFAPVAQVRHHRRQTIRGYLRQQIGYGRSERMLSGPHAHRFNRLGQARWAGVVYGGARLLPWLFRSVIYHGWMGMAPFQKVERRYAELANGWLAALLPLSLPLAVAGLLLAFVSPLWLLLPAAMVLLCCGYTLNVALTIQPGHHEPRPVAMRALVALMHLLQPFARTWGRLKGRPIRVPTGPQPPWSGQRADWVAGLRRSLEAQRCKVRPATVHQPWDLVAECGVFWRARIVTGVAWGWEPRQRVGYRLMLAPIAPCVAAVWLAWGMPAAVACGALLALVAYDGLVLRRRVRRALEETTAGAGA